MYSGKKRNSAINAHSFGNYSGSGRLPNASSLEDSEDAAEMEMLKEKLNDLKADLQVGFADRRAQ